MWAQESLAILEENMVAANLVHRDFSPLIASYGDTVNTRRPSKFKAIRKTGTEPVTTQDAIATNVPVVLDQLIHVSFFIYDAEASKSFKDLVTEYMRPAMLAHAQFFDKMVLGQMSQFLGNSYGHLHGLTVNNGTDSILGTREIMNKNLAYVNDRNMILTPDTETTLLNMAIFTQAQQVGDQGQALQEAFIGRKYGFNMYMAQNMRDVAGGDTTVAGAINNALGYAKGATTITVDAFAAAIANGSWFTIAGDDVPHRVTSTVGGATPTSIVFTPGLSTAIVDNAVVTSLTPGAVNLVAGYPAGYNKEIAVNGFTVAPKVGQIVSFGVGVGSRTYTIIDVNGLVGITLDRSLEVAIANSDDVNLGPSGSFNFAFHRNAIALVTRPMELPRQGIGAAAANVNYNGLSVRVVLT